MTISGWGLGEWSDMAWGTGVDYFKEGNHERRSIGASATACTASAPAATTPGSVAKKMQVFDETGASLGYVAIYDAIT